MALFDKLDDLRGKATEMMQTGVDKATEMMQAGVTIAKLEDRQHRGRGRNAPCLSRHWQDVL